MDIRKANPKTAGLLKSMEASAEKQWEALPFTSDGKLYHAYFKSARLKTGEAFDVQLIFRIRQEHEDMGFYGTRINLIFDRELPCEAFTLKYAAAKQRVRRIRRIRRRRGER